MKWVKRVFLAFFLAVFLFSVGTVGITLYQYRHSSDFYAKSAADYVKTNDVQAKKPASEPALKPKPESGFETAPVEQTVSQPEEEQRDPIIAPLEVDFEGLQKVNPDVIGWLYCEDTEINYPVLQGRDNEEYLHRLYDGSYCYGGSLFVEMENAKNFADYNTVIYGHNMRNGSMFGTLDEWADQAYYEAHPVFWLLTPEGDYRVDILGAYTTSAYSDTYIIFSEDGPGLDEYLDTMLRLSKIETDAKPEPGSKYVLMSTCAYLFNDARFVIHGKLVPADSAGGVVHENETVWP